MYNVILIFAVFLLCSYYSVESYTKNNVCHTPLGEESQCVPLTNCPAMVNFVKKAKKPFSAGIRDGMQKFVCTYSDKGTSTVVCCPSVSFDIDEKGTITGPTPPPPSIAGHESLKYLPENCGYINSDDKVYGGEDAGLTEFPWMALLLYKDGDRLVPQCGGTIIHKKYILTAAHCLIGTNIPPLAGVRVGEYSLASEKDCVQNEPDNCVPPVQHLLVEKIITHPGYSTNSHENDIALLRVTNVSFNEANVQPVCLPVHEETFNTDFSSGYVTGWGYTDPRGTNTVDKLQKLSLKRRDLKVCAEAFKGSPHVKVTANSYRRLCLGGEEGKDSCKGDSGGPYQVAYHIDGQDTYVQRGIVSFGHIECGKKGYPAIYTFVDYYMKWILDNIRP